MTERNKTLAQLAEANRTRAKLEIRTHSVATVVTFDPATRRASLRVDILQAVADIEGVAEPETVTPLEPLQLDGIPVHYPGSSQAGFAWTLAPGDKVELHVGDRSLDAWLQSGGIPQLPRARWTHSISDAVAYPTTIHAPSPVSPLGLEISATGLIMLGSAATSPAVLGDLLKTALDTYTATMAGAFAAWNLATSSGTAPTAIANGAYILAQGNANAILIGQLAAILSTKVTVQ